MAREWRLGETLVRAFDADLTEQAVEAIVNAANNDLQLGGGVAGAIRRRGGPAIQEDCDRIGPVEVGEAAATTGGNLPARRVIHAASMRLGGRTTAESLESAMAAAFRIAHAEGITSIAIPAVGTGIAGFPMGDCARIMASCLQRSLAEGWSPKEVRFVLFGLPATKEFAEAFGEALETPPGPD